MLLVTVGGCEDFVGGRVLDLHNTIRRVTGVSLPGGGQMCLAEVCSTPCNCIYIHDIGERPLTGKFDLVEEGAKPPYFINIHQHSFTWV